MDKNITALIFFALNFLFLIIRPYVCAEVIDVPANMKINPKKEIVLTLNNDLTADTIQAQTAMFRGNLQRTGTYDVHTGDNHSITQWRFKTSGHIDSTPIVDDGVVYFGSWDKNLYAVDIKTGKEIWKFKTGDNISSSPAIADGLVIFGSHDGYLYAVDIMTGRERWNFKTGAQIHSSPLVTNGVVYFGGGDKNLYAIDAKSGRKLWQFTTGGWVSSTPALYEGTVYFGSNDSHLYAVDAKTGQEKWEFKTGAVVCSPAIGGGTIYFGSWDKNLYAVDINTGKTKWTFKTEEDICSQPAIANDMVYYKANGIYLFAIDGKTGREKMKFKARGEIYSPSISDGVVYFGSLDGHLYAINSETGKKWRYKIEGGVFSSSAIIDEIILVGGYYGNMFAVPKQEIMRFPIDESGIMAVHEIESKIMMALDEDLIIEEYKLTTEITECFNLGCVPEEILIKRKKWRDRNYIERVNEQLNPLGYKFVKNGDRFNEPLYDLYKGKKLLHSALSYIYGVSINSSKTRFMFFARKEDEGAFFIDGKVAQWSGWRPQFLGNKIIDLKSVNNIQKEEFNFASVKVKRSKEQVVSGNKIIYNFDLVGYPFDTTLKDFYVHDDHWVLEYMDAKIEGKQVIDYFGTVVVDGTNLNKKYGYKEVFSYMYIDDMPFFLYEDQSGSIKISYAGRTLPFVYEEVKHYGCCSEASLNPEWNEHMIWFFGLRDGYWYYVEAGVYDRL